MTLDEIDVRWSPVRTAIGFAHRSQLPFDRRREQVADDVVRQAPPGERGENRVAVCECIREPLEHEDPRAFADDETIGLRIERRTSATLRQGAELCETHLRVQRIGPRTTAREHRIGAPREQFVGGQLERVQRRRTRRIERERAATEAERLRE